MRNGTGLGLRSSRGALFALALSGLLSACAYGSVGGEDDTELGDGIDEDSGPGAPTQPNTTGTRDAGSKDAAKDTGKDTGVLNTTDASTTDAEPTKDSGETRDANATDTGVADATTDGADARPDAVADATPDVRDAAPDVRDAGPDARDATVTVDAAPEASAPEASTPEASTPEASTPDVEAPPVDAGDEDDSGATYIGPATWSTDATGRGCPRLSRFAFDCPANGTYSEIWGNYIYSDDSSICTAAVHDGKISFANGGRIVVEMRPGERIYRSYSKNGVTSSAYSVPSGSPDWPCSFVLWPW